MTKWKYTGKKRSPAQMRQQHLFMKKGQITGMASVLKGIVGDPLLTPGLKSYAIQALKFITPMAEQFDKEVGWS